MKEIIISLVVRVATELFIHIFCFVGKSTFLKQMRIINEVEFNKEDVNEYKKTIYMNIIKGMFIRSSAILLHFK